MACLFAVAAHPQFTQRESGSICGTVQDENGAPAKLVTIAAFEADRSGPMRAERTDEQGHYCFRNMHLGKYAMSAEDEARGYPGLLATLYGARYPVVWLTIDAAHPTATSNWQIPYKAAFLRFEFVDASTGRPVPTNLARVHLVPRFGPGVRDWSGSSMEDKAWLLPPNEDIYVHITFKDYQAWPGDGSKGAILNYQPGSTHTVKVILLRSSPYLAPNED